MAAIDFPDSPSVNDTFTVGSKTWTWNGSYWVSDEAITGLDGLNDVTITSPVDGDVVQYDNGEFVNSPVDYTDLTSVPNDFTPSAHTHTKSEITDFSHTHTKSEVTDFAHASTHESGGTDEVSLTTSQISDVTATSSELNLLDGVTATTAEINHLDGVTSGIQTQLDGKVDESDGSVTQATEGSAVVRNITLSTAEPTSGDGSDGDVWLVYTP